MWECTGVVLLRSIWNCAKHVQTHNYPTKMSKIPVSIKQRKCFLIVQLEIADLLFGILWTKL